MIPCPVASWKQQRPDALALPGMTYEAFDRLIGQLCFSLREISEQILAFVPEQSPIDVAFFFAAWRMKKAVYPISFRHPEQAIQERLQRTGAKLVKPSPSSSALEIDTIDENSLATLIETSSAAKIVCHRFKALLTSAQSCAEALNLKMGDTYCLNLPLFHISGIALMLRTFCTGATMVFPDQWKEATHISMVPTQLFRLIEKQESLPKLKCLLVGGAPLSANLYKQALNHGLPIYCSYGMTESASMAVLKPPGKRAVILPHIELKLSEEGEILLKGPSLFERYFWKESICDWFPTRDIGRFNAQNELEIVGRKDRQFISGGENIIPEEIEKLLLQYPDVIEARVEPEADLEFGMCPIAKIYCKNDLEEDPIHNYLSLHLPRFKIPKKILISINPFITKQTSLIKDINRLK
jgi:O-succinylbenzoic acid--CoA ligase